MLPWWVALLFMIGGAVFGMLIAAVLIAAVLIAGERDDRP